MMLFYIKTNNLYALHRIVAIRNEMCVVCGDALKRKELIHKNEILGFC